MALIHHTLQGSAPEHSDLCTQPIIDSPNNLLLVMSPLRLATLVYILLHVIGWTMGIEREAWTEVTFRGRTYSLPRSYFDGRSDEANGRYHSIWARNEGTPPPPPPRDYGENMCGMNVHRGLSQHGQEREYWQVQRHEFVNVVEVENKRREEDSWKERIMALEKIVGICPPPPARVVIPGTENEESVEPHCQANTETGAAADEL